MPGSSFASFVIYDSTATGTNQAVARPENRAPAPRTFKVAGEGFTLPLEYAKTASVCAVYNLQGKFIRELSVMNNAVNLSRDYGMSRGIYIVRLRPQARP
jgi:hypothetical protein